MFGCGILPLVALDPPTILERTIVYIVHLNDGVKKCYIHCMEKENILHVLIGFYGHPVECHLVEENNYGSTEVLQWLGLMWGVEPE